MITFKTHEFDVHINPKKIAFLSKEPFEQDYIVCLSTGVGLKCTGTPTYDEMLNILAGIDGADHRRFKMPNGLDTCANPDFLFLCTVDVAKTTIVYEGGGRCVVEVGLEIVKEAFGCE